MKIKYILIFCLLIVMIYGIALGDFLETWRNGATLCTSCIGLN
ncbi:secreted protein [Candidatus Magnetomorum sp. HK-1]|nr:secreted protein [Candidatus Magnetomorum sp. HK-1]